MRVMAPQARLMNAMAPVATPATIPAPITGWNARDALDEMAPTDAVVLDNFYPDANGVPLRNGWQNYAKVAGAGVQTLAEYQAGGTHQFFAASGGHIYDISGAGSGVKIGGGFSSSIWQTANFLSRLFFLNGVDAAQIWDGTALNATAFTGVDQTTLWGIAVYQQRLFMWQQNSTGFWYALLNSISGAVAFYDLSAFSPRGGNLIAATTFTHDGGNGVQDYICFIMSSGDCLMFFGNDPALVTNWQLVGIYRLSPPVSPRAVCNYGAESYITTYDDHVPLQQQLVALKVGAMPPRSKISNAVQAAVIANKTGFGWQALYYPAGRRVIYNIPQPDGTFVQHVQNTSNQAYCRFTNMNALCWGLFNDNLYFGTAGGHIIQADTGNMDGPNPIFATGQQAWNDFGSPTRKRVTAVRPIVETPSGTLTYAFGVGFDFGQITIPVIDTTQSVGTPWNTSPWDISPWSPDIQVDTRWKIGGGTGQSIGFRLALSSSQPASWLRTDLRMEAGTAL